MQEIVKSNYFYDIQAEIISFYKFNSRLDVRFKLHRRYAYKQKQFFSLNYLAMGYGLIIVLSRPEVISNQ